VRATLKAGMTQRRKMAQILKDGIAERRKMPPNPERENRGTAERRNDGTVERRNGGTAERRKIPRNPKRWNGGKSSEFLKDGMTENHPSSV